MTAGRSGVIAKPASTAGGGTVVLRPNGTVATGVATGKSAWITFPSGTLHGVTSDDSDTTGADAYGQYGGDTYSPPADPAGTMILDLASSTIPGTIDSVTLRVRHRYLQGIAQVVAKQRVSGVDSAADTFSQSASIATATGATRTTQPGGGAWTQTAIDNLQVALSILNSTSGNTNVDLSVYEVYADVAYQ